jgi:hypothetical protein
MEMILLFFCLTSVVITSVIVAIEIRGDKTLSRQSYKGEMNTINFHGQQILAKDKNTNEQLRNRVLETLDQQLNQLGYLAKEPQLQFINNTLNSEHAELEELTPNELQMTFSASLIWFLTKSLVTWSSKVFVTVWARRCQNLSLTTS